MRTGGVAERVGDLSIEYNMPKAKRKTVARVTVQDIADLAGVSIGAVSSVLTNRHQERRISPETVDKIRAASAKLGYLPNISARRLRSGASQKNHLVLAYATSYEAPLNLASHLLSELRQSTGRSGGAPEGVSFSLMMELFPGGKLKEMPGLLTGDLFNAALITNTTNEDDAYLTTVQLPYPVVLVNRTIQGYSSVVEDPDSGAAAWEVLESVKRRKLAVLHGTPLTQTTQARVDSFLRAALGKTGRAAASIAAEDLSESAAYEAMIRFLEKGERVDGLYAVTDGMALGAFHAIKEKGLRIPEDIAVVGVGDYDISAFFDPPLTVVGVQRTELGREASRLLWRQIEQAGRTPLKVEVPVQVVLRTSTGH